jgi:hypothetical protein
MALKMTLAMVPRTVMMKRSRSKPRCRRRGQHFRFILVSPTFPWHTKKRYNSTFDSAILQTFNIDGDDERSKEEIQVFLK